MYWFWLLKCREAFMFCMCGAMLSQSRLVPGTLGLMSWMDSARLCSIPDMHFTTLKRDFKNLLEYFLKQHGFFHILLLFQVLNVRLSQGSLNYVVNPLLRYLIADRSSGEGEALISLPNNIWHSSTRAMSSCWHLHEGLWCSKHWDKLKIKENE